MYLEEKLPLLFYVELELIDNIFQIEDARLIIDFENKDMNSKPECEPLLTDWIHAVIFLYFEELSEF